MLHRFPRVSSRILRSYRFLRDDVILVPSLSQIRHGSTKSQKTNVDNKEPEPLKAGERTNEQTDRFDSQLDQCGFDGKWRSSDSKWMKEADLELANLEAYMHNMGDLASPNVADHTDSDLCRYFAVNRSILPWTSAGLFHVEWERYNLASLMVRKPMFDLLQRIKDLGLRDARLPSHSGAPPTGGSEVHVVDGVRGTGKSAVMNYITMYARQNNWLTLSIPNARLIYEKKHRLYEATDRPKVHYQIGMAQELFQCLRDESADVLNQVKLKRKYTSTTPSDSKKGETSNDDKRQDLEHIKKSSNSSQEAVKDAMSAPELTPEEYEMLMANAKREADLAEANREEILAQLDEDFRALYRRGCDTNFSVAEDSSATLLDLVEHGCDDLERCPNPAALFYDFIEELRLCDEVPVLVSVDAFNYWRGLSPFRSTNGEKLHGEQLSIVDAISELKTPGMLKNGVVLLARGSYYPSAKDVDEIFQKATATHKMPDQYSLEEFDAALKHYQSADIFLKDTKFNRSRIEGISGRLPADVFKYARQY